MLIYFVVAFIVLFFSFVGERQNYPDSNLKKKGKNSPERKICLLIVCVTLIFVSAFRYYVGTDYGEYRTGYETLSSNFWGALRTFNAPGMRLVAIIASKIYDAPETMFALMALLTIGLCTRTIIKNTPYFCLGLLLYVFMGYWHGSFNAVRQAAAAAIIFAGHRYIIDKKFFKYLLVVFLASCFHIASVIMIIPYFIGNIKFNIKNSALLVAGVILILLGYDQVFGLVSFLKDTTVSFDSSSYMSTSVNIFRILVAVVPVIAVFVFAERDSNDKEYNFYTNMIIIHAAAMVATAGSAYLARIGIFTGLFSCLAFPRVFLRKRTKDALILTRIMTILYFVYWVYEIAISNALNNFRWIWG